LRDVGGRKPRRVGDADNPLVMAGAALFDLLEQIEDALGRLGEGALPNQRDQEIDLAIGLAERPFFADQPVEQFGGAAAGDRHVDMRIGAVADHRAGVPHHLRRHVGVEVEAADDRQRLADQPADAAQQLALAVLVMRRDHRAVQVEIDAVERAGAQRRT
jgi:hypothetical protein